MGWNRKQAARVLGVHPKKCPQALSPAIEKVAKLLLADPAATFDELFRAMERLNQDAFEQHELPLREQMLAGRLDRSVIHPTTRT